MEVAEMVLNKVNKELVTMIQSLGVNAVPEIRFPGTVSLDRKSVV